MRIAIDTHAIGSGLTGNERYIQNLAQQLLLQDSKNEYFLFFSREEAREQWVNRAPNLQTYLVSANPIRRLNLDFFLQLRRLRPQVFHYQYTGPLLRASPEVVTIHDVSFERHPEFFTPFDRLRLQLTVRRAVQSARRIITVSEFSRSEIVHWLRVPKDKVKVIYNGVDPQFHPIQNLGAICSCLESYGVRKPYLLSIGDICRRKNQCTLVHGFARWLKDSGPREHQLVLVGKRGAYGRDVLAEITRWGLDGKVLLLGYVADCDVPYLYSGATLLLNVSLYEGFGFPTVEAMACGLPVIASRASCFPEIGGDAAQYVDPQNPNQIAEAIAKIIENETVKNELVARGLRRAQQFRWEEAARETLCVYYEAAGSASR